MSASYVIYKIYCDTSDAFYVGSTKNFTKRKCDHKTKCNNPTQKSDSKLYRFIRENGGWDNWNMVIVEEYGDITKQQAHIKEEEYRVNLKATLNSYKPIATKQERKESKSLYNKIYGVEYRVKKQRSTNSKGERLL
jgi:predicted GIY-YIG superfamily endonuclease